MDSKALETVVRLAKTSRLGRFINNPFRYLYAIGFKDLVYKITKRPRVVSAELFFGKRILVALPSSTDIYLTGGKSHDSEIRLARHMIASLKQGDCIIDIGAHCGYFSLLAAELIGPNGKVFAFEPAASAYALLEKNCRATTVTTFKNLISDTSGPLKFYEFPDLYSEYSTLEVEQFENEDWFKKFSPAVTEEYAYSLDDFIAQQNIKPDFIKIDVEGAEARVMEGARHLLENGHPVIAMEYLSAARGNEGHVAASKILYEHGFESYLIRDDGSLFIARDIESHLQAKKLESDNVVFRKN